MLIRDDKLLTTKQLPEITGFSESFFEKGRIYGYGPAYAQPTGKCGRVLYRFSKVLAWMERNRRDPEGPSDG